IERPAGDEQDTSRARTKKYRSRLAKLLPNQQYAHGFPAERDISEGNARSFECSFGARKGVRCVPYYLSAPQHQSLGFNLYTKRFFPESRTRAIVGLLSYSSRFT